MRTGRWAEPAGRQGWRSSPLSDLVRRARLGRIRPHDVWDIGIGLVVFGGYLAVAARTRSQVPRANAYARRVAAAERWLGLSLERAANRWTAAHPVVTTIANYDYALGYLASTLGILGWLRAGGRPDYVRHEVSLLAINAVAVAMFAVCPVTPPRLLADAGFVDTVKDGHTVGSWGSAMISATANEHAAMPSLHVAWTTWVAATLAAQGAPLWLRRTAVLQVCTTTAVIVMTGNHWLLDAAAGAIVATVVDRAVGTGFRAGSRLERVRRCDRRTGR